MRIPQIIHQTWKTDCLPETLKTLTDTWKEFHPDWQYIYWTDAKNREFVCESFPQFLKTYDDFELNIQRVDMIRYLILHKLGGVYIDIDFECFKNIENLLDDNECVFFTEPQEHCLMHHREFLLCNAFMASVPEHPYIKMLINETVTPGHNVNSNLKVNPNLKVMESTGPYMVTRVYEQNKDRIDITILGPEYVYPLTRREVMALLNDKKISQQAQKKLDNSVAVHYWLNTWVDVKFF